MTEDEKFELVVGIATGGLTVEQTAQTLRRHVLPRDGQHALARARKAVG